MGVRGTVPNTKAARDLSTLIDLQSALTMDDCIIMQVPLSENKGKSASNAVGENLVAKLSIDYRGEV